MIKIVPYFDDDYTEVKALLEKNGMWYDTDNRNIFKKIANPDIYARYGEFLLAKKDDKLLGVIHYVFNPWLSIIYHFCSENTNATFKLYNTVVRAIKSRGGEYIAGYILEDNEKMLKLSEKMGFEKYPKPCYAIGKKL